jgi:uncharacterized protein
MQIGRLPVDGQLKAFRETLTRNDVLTEALAAAAKLSLPGWYLTAGCLVQTVWNVVTGRAPTAGIKDYDLFYFDRSDLGWDAENAAIQEGGEVFRDVPAEVEIRNEARVHLWYEQRYGVPCAPYTSTEHAIDSFPATTCCVGVHVTGDGQWRIYAPHGLADVFNLVVRPNPVQAPGHIYDAKARRWLEHWPELTVLPWPDTA